MTSGCAIVFPMRIDRWIVSAVSALLFTLTASPPARSATDWRVTLKIKLGPRRTTLLRCIARGRRLPRWGDLRVLDPFSAEWADSGTPVDTYFNDRFFAENAGLITGKVLEG